MQQRARVGFVGRRNRNLPSTAGQRRRDGEIAIERAHVIDDVVLDLDELIVGIRHDAFLQIERDERHHDADASNGATIRANVTPDALSAVISLSPESRCTASSVPSSSAIGITSTMSAGKRPAENEQRRPKRRVLVAHELADIENLGRRKDQREGRQSEDERSRQLRRACSDRES